MGIFVRERSLSYLWLSRNFGSCLWDALERSEIGDKPSLELTPKVLERGNEVLNKGSKSVPERINSKDICITNRIWQLVAHKRIE